MEMKNDDQNLLSQGDMPESEVSLRLKYFLLGFSMFFWLIGGLFCAIGGYVTSQKMGFEEIADFASDPGIILTALGCLIFIISSFGVLGSLRENICLLKTYKYLLLITLVLELVCALIGFAFWPEVKKMIDRNLSVAVEKYTSNVDLRNMIDNLQRNLECCGSLTIDDWDSNPYFSCQNQESYRSCGVPWSCCLKKYERNRQCGYGVRRNRVHVKTANEIHTIGCLDKGVEFFHNNILLVAIMAIVFTFPLIAGIFMTHTFVGQILRQVVKVNREKVFL